MNRPGGPTRWFAAGLTLALAALLALNRPFYAGADHGRCAWRLEHGRLTLELEPASHPQPRQAFWVAASSEGLRWLPELEGSSLQEWSVTLPLWMPLLLALLWNLRVWMVPPRGSAR